MLFLGRKDPTILRESNLVIHLVLGCSRECVVIEPLQRQVRGEDDDGVAERGEKWSPRPLEVPADEDGGGSCIKVTLSTDEGGRGAGFELARDAHGCLRQASCVSENTIRPTSAAAGRRRCCSAAHSAPVENKTATKKRKKQEKEKKSGKSESRSESLCPSPTRLLSPEIAHARGHHFDPTRSICGPGSCTNRSAGHSPRCSSGLSWMPVARKSEASLGGSRQGPVHNRRRHSVGRRRPCRGDCRAEV